MTARSVLRGLGYMLKEVEAFVPWQAWRCALGTDFAWRQSQAAYAHDAMVGLDEFEEANEVHEPRAQCKWCGGVDTPGHDCGRQYVIGRDIKVGEKYCALCGVQLGEDYHACPARTAGPQQDLSPLASAGSGGNPVGVESPTPPAGVDPPSRTSPKVDGEGPAGDRGIRSSAPAGHPSFTEWATPVIADALDEFHGYTFEYAANAIAERIEAALTQEGKHVTVTNIYPMESGQDIGTSMACEFFPQYQQK